MSDLLYGDPLKRFGKVVAHDPIVQQAKRKRSVQETQRQNLYLNLLFYCIFLDTLMLICRLERTTPFEGRYGFVGNYIDNFCKFGCMFLWMVMWFVAQNEANVYYLFPYLLRMISYASYLLVGIGYILYARINKVEGDEDCPKFQMARDAYMLILRFPYPSFMYEVQPKLAFTDEDALIWPRVRALLFQGVQLALFIKCGLIIRSWRPKAADASGNDNVDPPGSPPDQGKGSSKRTTRSQKKTN